MTGSGAGIGGGIATFAFDAFGNALVQGRDNSRGSGTTGRERTCYGGWKGSATGREKPLFQRPQQPHNFLEVHPDPAHALSDAATMLALDDLPALLRTLKAIEMAAGTRSAL